MSEQDQVWIQRVRGMVGDLYADGKACRQQLDEAEAEIVQARRVELSRWKTLRDTQQMWDDEVASALYVLSQDKVAHGGNDSQRKASEADMVRKMRLPDSRTGNLWKALQEAGAALEEAKSLRESCIDTLSTARAKAHIIAGLGRALGA
jgi:hypothetical protein